MYQSPEQLEALRAAKAHWGRNWKRELSECWLISRYPRKLEQCGYLLQQVRNQGGPGFLKDFRFPTVKEGGSDVKASVG